MRGEAHTDGGEARMRIELWPSGNSHARTKASFGVPGEFMTKLLCVPLFLLAGASVMAQDWAQFRGPGGLDLSNARNLPAEWNDDKNLLWKAKLPGRGASSPI